MGRLNKVMLIGNTGNDIKMHFFEGGGCVGNVSLATTEIYKKQDGEKVENTEWHNLVFRNKPAELIEKYAPKGAKLYIEGRLKYRKWQDDKGNDRYSTEIHVSYFEFVGGKPDSNNSAPQQQTQQSPQEPTGDNDDLPF